MGSLTANNIKRYCERLGVRLSVQGNCLRVYVPNRIPDAIQAKLKGVLIANKSSMIALLEPEPCPCPVAKLRKRSERLFQCPSCGQVWVMGLMNRVAQ